MEIHLMEKNPYQYALEQFPQGYFCNLTSIFYHQLTQQIPQAIYMGIEVKRNKDQEKDQGELSDHAIFNAFIKPHRKTKRTHQYGDHQLIVTERVGRGKTGIIKLKSKHSFCPFGASITSLERALIDAVVHPQYNGGIARVIEYYEKSIRKVKIRRLLDIYQALELMYPYWQSIGFIFERLGFLEGSEKIYESFPLRNKFYLDHQAKTTWQFDEKWQLYYPEEFFYAHR